MDQDRFEQRLMDYLAGDLDEVTTAAMKRKLESDIHCRELEAGLRATLEVGQLPLEEPSEDLEDRILSAAARARDGDSWHQKLARTVLWAGSHAMRPQLAMAALLVLVIGSSILLLRARPATVAVTASKEDRPAAAPVAQTTPTSAPSDQQPAAPEAVAGRAEQAARPGAGRNAAPSATASAAAALAAGEVDVTYERGVRNYRGGNFSEARRDLTLVSNTSNAKAASASLYLARAVRAESHCAAAIPYYRALRSRFAKSAAAADATWEQADCHRQLGQRAEARKLLIALTKDRTYGARAAHELRAEGEAGGSGKQGLAAKRRSSTKSSGGSGGQGKARPAPRDLDDAAGL